MRLVSILIVSALALSGCARLADSRVNPLNWFGGSQPVQQAAQTPETLRPLVPQNALVTQTDARALVDEVLSLRIDRTPSGGIIAATGRSAAQGAFNAQLVLVSQEAGRLTYDFRIERPGGFQAVGTPASRTVTVAEVLSTQQLAGVREIVVRGRQSSRSTRR